MPLRKVAKVEFVGEFPFVVPLVTWSNGESEFLVGGRENENKAVTTVGIRGESTIRSPSASFPSSPVLEIPQLNIKPLTEYLEQVSKNMATALTRIMPKQESVDARKETQAQYIQRLQKEGKLYPQCEDSSFVLTKCVTCDRKEICDILREEERRRQEEFDRLYGSR